jgi:hypothetical protein
VRRRSVGVTGRPRAHPRARRRFGAPSDRAWEPARRRFGAGRPRPKQAGRDRLSRTGENRGSAQGFGPQPHERARIRRHGPLARVARPGRVQVGGGVKMVARGVAGGGGLISECARMRVPTGRLRIVSTQPTEVAEVQEGPPSPGRYIREARLRRGPASSSWRSRPRSRARASRRSKRIVSAPCRGRCSSAGSFAAARAL